MLAPSQVVFFQLKYKNLNGFPFVFNIKASNVLPDELAGIVHCHDHTVVSVAGDIVWSPDIRVGVWINVLIIRVAPIPNALPGEWRSSN